MNKETILIATLELASQKGLGRISMSQIAQKVGLKKSSLYSHYRSKEEIITNMYQYFRNKAKEKKVQDAIDYEKLIEGHTLNEVLLMVVNSYKEMNQDSTMAMFYKVIESERIVNKVAAEIMVIETNTMIQTTKDLFYVLQDKSIAHFENIDIVATSFALTVHSIMEFEIDTNNANRKDANGIMEKYINEFCHLYGDGGKKI